MTITKQGEPAEVSWDRISINGQQLGMRDLELDSKGEPVRAERLSSIPLGSTAGSYQLTGQFLISEEAAALFDQICGTRSQQEPGEPKIEYREREGAIWRSAGGVQGIHVNGLGPMEGKAWERLGPTRGPYKSDRLRKFVWRRGQLVEVRTRGRTGTRSLRAAIEAVGPPPNLFGPLVMQVDLVLKAAAPLITMQIDLTDAAPLLTCDVCGIEFPGDQVGSSYIRIPDSDVSTEDMRDRCARCTAEHGPLARPPAGGTVGAKLENHPEEKPDHEPAPHQEDTDGINF